ncbi:MAG: hypothetical protein NTY77_15840 [Elusimicrobia bacterium]|nr:hypothetical protein [Elusimicrobiota bacterium]
MRLLLVEFFPKALRYGENTMLFPFLKGLARAGGFQTSWLCFAGALAPASGKPSGRTSQARLSPADLRVLSAHLGRFRPSHVVSSEVLAPEVKAVLRDRTPPPKLLVMPMLQEAARGAPAGTEMGRHLALVSGDPRRRDYFGRCAWFLDWLGVAAPALARKYLVVGARPDYAALLANPEARSAAQQITIVSGRLCGNRRTLARNLCFRGLDARAVREHRGCSFCRSPSTPSLTPPGKDMLAVVESQLRGVLDTAGPAGRDKRIFEFYDFQAMRRFDEVFALVLRLKMPPSVFLFNPRLDEVLRARRRIRKTLPALARAGHEVRCLSMGIENFSERENARLNKGISLAQVDEFLALTKEWDASYPGVFKPFKAGHDKVELGLILFTPWTTLADLRLNLARARERGFPERGDWLYSTLHVHSNAPIYLLARRDGLLAGRWPDRGMGYGLYKNQGEAGPMVPWRFQSPRVADFFALLVRLCAADREGAACPFFRGDREFRRVSRFYARSRVTPLAFAQALLDIIGPVSCPLPKTFP